VAGHVRFELRNVVVNYPFERSHRFPEIQPYSGHGDYSRLSCGAGDPQLGPEKKRKEKQRNKLFSTHRLRPRGLQRHLETTACDRPITLRQGARVIEDSRHLRMASWSDKGMSRNGSALRIISASGRLMALPFPNPEPRRRSTACKDSRAMSTLPCPALSVPRRLTIRLQ
jgi:hypothetical protein